MSTSYRKSGTRRYYKIYNDGKVCFVLNQENWSEIRFGINGFMIADVLDPYDPGIKSHEITESEFNQAYKYALDRITMQRLDI